MANVIMIVLFTTSFMESGTFGETFEVQLEKLSALYLPYQYAPIDYKMNKRASVAVAYDAEKQIIYSVGMYFRYIMVRSNTSYLVPKSAMNSQLMLISL